MPVEIHELVIRATVASSGATSGPRAETHSDEEAVVERLVAQCVGQVLEILRKQKER